MAMITCRECGKQISDTADICPHCGAKVNQITVKSSASSKHLIIYATLIILGAFVFFVGLGIFFDDINTYYPHYNYRSPLTSHESQVISTIVVGFALYDDILGPQLSFPAELRVLFSLKHIMNIFFTNNKRRGRICLPRRNFPSEIAAVLSVKTGDRLSKPYRQW